MTNEEKKIHDIGGRKNPFLLPEDYFENFNRRLADRLPYQPVEETVPMAETKEVRLFPRLWRYAAAVLFMAGFAVSALYLNQSNTLVALADDEASQEEEYVNETLDYIMVDNMEIAEYLTEAY